MERKILIMGPRIYGKWIDGFKEVDDLKDADLVIFTGGEDVDPSLYDERKHPLTHSRVKRDLLEKEVFKRVLKANVPMLGICRGSQFLTVMSGGKLVQHVNNHGIGATHEIKTSDGKVMNITSTHHQMMYPYTASEYEVIAVANPKRSDVYMKNDVTTYEMKEEPEVVWYPHTKCLCIQGHPEYMNENEYVISYLNKLIKEKCFG